MTAAARAARIDDARAHVAAVHDLVRLDLVDDVDVDDCGVDVAALVPAQRAPGRAVDPRTGAKGLRLALLERQAEWLRDEQRRLVHELRAEGLPWEAIGTGLGIGGRATSARYSGRGE